MGSTRTPKDVLEKKVEQQKQLQSKIKIPKEVVNKLKEDSKMQNEEKAPEEVSQITEIPGYVGARERRKLEEQREKKKIVLTSSTGMNLSKQAEAKEEKIGRAHV